MKFVQSAFVAVFFLLVGCSTSVNGQKGKNTLKKYDKNINGESRSYWVYNPKEDESDTFKNLSRPVVFMFHGSKSSGEAFSEGTNFNVIAKREKLIVVYPDALVGNWAEGCGCNNADRLKVKDLEFVEVMIKELVKNYNADARNIFAVGFSQGGLFVDRLACELDNQLRGAVVVAATMSVPLSKSCNPKASVPLTFIQGTNDPVLPYGGIENGPLSLLSAKSTANFWARKNGISVDPQVRRNGKVEILQYSEEEENSKAVTLFSIKGYGHGWPMLDSFSTNEKVAAFISKHRTNQ